MLKMEGQVVLVVVEDHKGIQLELVVQEPKQLIVVFLLILAHTDLEIMVEMLQVVHHLKQEEAEVLVVKEQMGHRVKEPDKPEVLGNKIFIEQAVMFGMLEAAAEVLIKVVRVVQVVLVEVVLVEQRAMREILELPILVVEAVEVAMLQLLTEVLEVQE